MSAHQKYVYFHVDEVARDPIVASILKKKLSKNNVKVYYGNRRTTFALSCFNPFDLIIIPNCDFIANFTFFKNEKSLSNFNTPIVMLPSEGVGLTINGRKDKDVIQHYLGKQYSHYGNKAISDKVHTYCFWGKHPISIIKKNASQLISRCKVIGAPRFDENCFVLKVKAKTEKIKLGFIGRLASTNPFDNRSILEQVLTARKKTGDEHYLSEGRDVEDLYCSEIIDIRIFFSIIEKINLQTHEIILRCHPRENWHNWHKLIKKYKLPVKISQWDQPFTHWLGEVDYVIGAGSTSFYDCIRFGKIPICTNDIEEKRNNHIIDKSDDQNELAKYVFRPKSIEELIELISKKPTQEIKISKQIETILKEEASYPDSKSSINTLKDLCLEILEESKQNNFSTAFKVIGYNTIVKLLNMSLKRFQKGSNLSSNYFLTKNRIKKIDFLAYK